MFDATNASTDNNTSTTQAFFRKTWNASVRNSDRIGYRSGRAFFAEIFKDAIAQGFFMPTPEDLVDLVKQIREDYAWNLVDAISTARQMFPMLTMPDPEVFTAKPVTLPAGVERYIHIDRSEAGTKVVREVNNVDMGYFCKEVEIKGESTLVTLEEELPSGTKHVIKTSAELVMTFTTEHNSNIQDISGHRC
jgi:hypothetical protein